MRITRRRLIATGSASIPLAQSALAAGFLRRGGQKPPPLSLKAVSSIGTATGRDFPTIDAWLTKVKALGTISITTYPNGVTGQCYNDSEFTPGELIFGGVDTSQFVGTGIFAITLTAAPGQSFADNNANGLAYNRTNGVGLNFNQASYPITGGGITVSNQGPVKVTSLLLSRLQIKVSTGNYGVYTDNNTAAGTGLIQLQQLIIDDFAGGQGIFTGTVTRGYNCCLIIRGPQDPTVCPHGGIFDGPAGVGAKFYGWTIVSPSDNTNGLPNGQHPHNAWSSSAGEGGGTTTFENCAFFGFQEITDYSAGTGATYSGCATDTANITTNLYCTGHASQYTGRIDNGTPGNAGTTLTVSNVTSGALAAGQYVGGTFGGSINPPNFTKITAQTGGTTGGAGTYTIDTSLNVSSQLMTTFVATNPNTGAGVTGNLNYNNSFTGTTNAAANFRLKTGSALIVAGTADSANLPTDIFGNPRPLTGAIDIGCHEITPPAMQMLVNGSSTPAAVIAGDHIYAKVVGIPNATGIRVQIEDGSGSIWNVVPGDGYIAYTGSSQDLDIALSARNQFGQRSPIGVGSGTGTTPGTFHARLYFDSNPGVVQLDVPFTINNWVPYPFPLLSGTINPNQMVLMLIGIGAVAGGSILAGSLGFAQAVQGNIGVGITITGPASGVSPQPTNITMQFYAVDGSLTYHAIGSPAFGSPPGIASFNTATLPDGSYLIFGKIIDIADTSATHYVAANFAVVPTPVIIQNGASPMNPAGNFVIPVAYYGDNHRYGSTTPDAVPYNGIPVAAAASPYPSDAAVGNYLLPVYNASSPFNGNPASARHPPLGFWWQDVDGVRSNEYKSPVEWRATNAGGIFSMSFIGKNVGDESIEGSYPNIAQGSYRDGGRNSNQTTNFTTVIASPTAGPWSAYHWTFIQEDGRLGVMNLAGDKVTIAGYKRNLTQLAIDWKDKNNAEFPNSVIVGTRDTSALYTFSDFGGGAADCCWDPRDPFICYVSQTVDHCIIKINFHTQMLGGVNYSATNPLCQRYAGYKGGVLGDGNGGYVDGVALSTGAGGAQFAGVYSICMMKRTDVAGYPQGTMFVADNYNGLIRVISAGTLDLNGNQATPSNVTTLVGTAGGAMPPPGAHVTSTVQNFNSTIEAIVGPITVTSLTLSGTTATVVLASGAGIPASTIAANGWKIKLFANGSPWSDNNSSIIEHDSHFGIYTLTSFTDSTHFQIGPIASIPLAGATLTVTVSAADTYSSPNPIAFTASNCFLAYPNTIRMTGKGHIVLCEAWYNGMTRLIALSNAGGETANTIRRIGPFGSLADASGTNSQSFAWIDVDDAVTSTAGAFTDPGLGACGPQDDVVIFKTDSNPGSAATATRFSLAGVDVSGPNGQGNWFGDGGPDVPSEGAGGVGHYPWAFCFSKTAFRILSIGLDPTGWFQWRPKAPSDPDGGVNPIAGVGSPISLYNTPYFWVDTGWVMWQQGSRGILPYGIRPAIAAMMGSNGLHNYGAGTGPVMDDLPALYPTNAALAAYIQGTGTGQTGSFFGSVKRPEFSYDDDGVTPGRALAALMYFIRRQALSGSWPTQQAGLFAYQSSLDGSGVLIASGQFSLNYIRPQITITSAPTRVNATSINVAWTTDKFTLGMVIAGTPNSNISNQYGFYPYNFYTTLEMDNSGVWGTTHNVTITGLPANNVTPPAGLGNAPNRVAVLVIDRAGNWNISSNFSVA